MKCLLIVLLALVAALARVYTETVIVEVVDIIDGGTASLVSRAVEALHHEALLLVYINSYGGYLSSADAIAELLVTKVPSCAAYVPPGGKAVSAAALVSVACGRIYMAPGSVIGAAKPHPEDPKVTNYVASRFRSLARRVFSNDTTVEIVVRFVTEALVLTDEEAESYGIAKRVGSLEDVLRELNAPTPGRVFSKDLWDKLLSIISDPLVYSIALSLGVFLIVAEVLVTGFQGYAVAGVVLIAMALYGMNAIPPDILTLTLMVSGAALVAVEMLTPGLSGFGVAGLALLFLGFYMAVRGRPVPAEPLVLGAAVALAVLGAFFGVIVLKAAQSIRLKKLGVRERLVGSIGVAKTDLSPTKPGVVYVAGEEWSAYSLGGVIASGRKVVVREIKGLFLYVEEVE